MYSDRADEILLLRDNRLSFAARPVAAERRRGEHMIERRVIRMDVRHVTSSAFKDVEIGQVVKPLCYSTEPHDLSAAWAPRRLWALVAHGTLVLSAANVPDTGG
jgi:hypothetical protein